MKTYGYSDEGLAIKLPAGWKLLPEGEYVPPVHREANETGKWLQPRRCQSTMTPIYARVSGYVRAFAVPESYSLVPEGATDVVRDSFEGDFGRMIARVTYYQRFEAFGMKLLKYWTGREWQVAGTLPWDRLTPLEAA